MTCDISYRPIRSDECSAVIALHQQVFPHKEVVRSIYGCHGVAQYLASLIAFPKWQKEHLFWGAWQGSSLIGYAHFRTLPESFHLNNIAVLRKWQKHGIGTALWAKFVQAARKSQRQRISLDVDAKNQKAVSWYERKGMEVAMTKCLYEKSLSHAVFDADKVRLFGWTQANAWQATYGFSQFRLSYGTSSWIIDCLGKDFFRTSQPIPIEVEGVLAEIDPQRRLLFCSVEPLGTRKGLSKIKTTFRMSGETSSIII